MPEHRREGDDSVRIQGDAGSVIDPSRLTTQMVWREVESLKELLITRLDAIEKATIVAHEDLVRVPTEVQKQVAGLRELHDEKFIVNAERIASLAAVLEKYETEFIKVAKLEESLTDFKEVVTENKKDSKEAVSAALLAAKELVANQNASNATAAGKNEANVTKQIDGLTTLIQTLSNGLEGKISDVKDRLTRIEGVGIGAASNNLAKQASGSYAFMIAGFVVAVLGLISGVMIVIFKH